MYSIVVDAYLDERSNAAGGKGRLKIWVDDVLIVNQTAQNLPPGALPHWWACTTYMWNNPSPYAYTKAVFWKTAKMFVYPLGYVPG